MMELSAIQQLQEKTDQLTDQLWEAAGRGLANAGSWTERAKEMSAISLALLDVLKEGNDLICLVDEAVRDLADLNDAQAAGEPAND